MKPVAILTAALLALATAAQADLVRLPPSVGATPIEIPGAGRQSATPIEIPGGGSVSATPIERPGTGQVAATPIEIPGAARVATLPPVVPSRGLESFDPRGNPGYFAVLPVPLPDPRHVGREGRFSYAALADGSIYGDTNFGYGHFASLEDYRRFLNSH